MTGDTSGQGRLERVDRLNWRNTPFPSEIPLCTFKACNRLFSTVTTSAVFNSPFQIFAALAVPPPEQAPLERIRHGGRGVPFDGT